MLLRDPQGVTHLFSALDFKCWIFGTSIFHGDPKVYETYHQDILFYLSAVSLGTWSLAEMNST